MFGHFYGWGGYENTQVFSLLGPSLPLSFGVPLGCMSITCILSFYRYSYDAFWAQGVGQIILLIVSYGRSERTCASD